MVAALAANAANVPAMAALARSNHDQCWLDVSGTTFNYPNKQLMQTRPFAQTCF